ncbi:acyl carrier protein [Paracoccus aminophilus]|uniref:Acyl carrier protein n=1 Tax=Paracoccus aminophilus JCM 7686 TaxID=1367847 RepID=S5XVC9_PARAH|nr:acyl carrier protein [Paracoccus aminophilus]AGT09202.1 acyl carrier protein [Paracoccus aminophilus JCM 7686]
MMITQTIVNEALVDLLDLDETSLTPEARFEEIEGWDSVNALRLLVFLEREIGAKLDYNAYMACKTLGQLAQLTVEPVEVAS